MATAPPASAPGPFRRRTRRFVAAEARCLLAAARSPSRTLWDTGTLLEHSPHLAGLHPDQRLRVNPYELDRLGLTSGDGSGSSRPGPAWSLTSSPIPPCPKGAASLLFGLPGDGPAELIDANGLVADVRLETV